MENIIQVLEKFYSIVISIKINMQDVSTVVLRVIMPKIATKKKCVIIVNRLDIELQSVLWEKYVIFASNLAIRSLIVLVPKTTVLSVVNKDIEQQIALKPEEITIILVTITVLNVVNQDIEQLIALMLEEITIILVTTTVLNVVNQDIEQLIALNPEEEVEGVEEVEDVEIDNDK
jgi:hypothetical protein